MRFTRNNITYWPTLFLAVAVALSGCSAGPAVVTAAPDGPLAVRAVRIQPQPSLLDLSYYPVPVPRSFHRHCRSRLALGQVAANGPRSVGQSVVHQPPALGFFPLHPRVVLVTVKRDLLPPARLLPCEDLPGCQFMLSDRVAHSYFHSEARRLFPG